MNILVDTNILNRFVEPGQAMYHDARTAVKELLARGHVLCITPQNCYEFWVVCTRPVANNGLGLSSPAAARELASIRNAFPMLDDTPAIFPAWQTFVQTYAVLGKTAHDARLVAAMQVHGITHLLTFNDKDFRRFTTITVLTPAGVLAAPPPP